MHLTPGGACLIGPVHHHRKSLSEKHSKWGWSLEQFWHPILGNHWTSLIFRPLIAWMYFSCMLSYTLFPDCLPFWRTGVSLPNFLHPLRGSSAGSVNLIPFFSSYFPVFDTLNAIRVLRAGWCTGPNETCPPPPPRDLTLLWQAQLEVCSGYPFVKERLFFSCQLMWGHLYM